MATVSLYTNGGSEYYLTVGASVSGSYISAWASLEPRYSGSSFSSHHGRQLSVSINGISSNSVEVTDCSQSNPGSVSVGASVGNGSYTITATWSNPNSGSGTYAPASGSVSMSVSVNATTYRTVSFNMNGHGTQIANQSVANGNKATKPTDPTESGWVFVGWYSNSALTVAYDFNTAVTSNITLYAKWEEEGVLRVYANSVWQKAIPYRYTSGQWKQCKAFIYESGEWKRGK